MRDSNVVELEEFCHCGKHTVGYTGMNGDGTLFTRDMCNECSDNRCDLVEDPCPNDPRVPNSRSALLDDFRVTVSRSAIERVAKKLQAIDDEDGYSDWSTLPRESKDAYRHRALVLVQTFLND